MPRQGSTNRAVRFPDTTLWERFGEVAEPDRSAVIRDLIRWYVGDGELPTRPDRSADPDLGREQ